ncbi:MAG: hypothetical protein H0U45_11905 [Tatlockia sp.]|nr:hypothetical protein [Tatlockia sp.]
MFGFALVMMTRVQPLLAQEVNSNRLCQKLLLNSSCSRDSSIDKKPQTQFTVPQVIKVKLNKVSNVTEWMRIERTGNQVKLLHTTIAPSIVSTAIRAISGIPSVFSDSGTARAVGIVGRLPPLAYTWYDHPTSRIFFQPDSCQGEKETSSCVLKGTSTIELPAETDLSQGKFTVEYTERKLLRTVTFRVPPQKS